MTRDGESRSPFLLTSVLLKFILIDASSAVNQESNIGKEDIKLDFLS